MMQKIRVGFLIAAVAACAQWPVNADEVASSALTLKGRTEAAASSPRPCVLLKNDNVLFGQAEQFGEFVIVRTGNGSELQLPRKQVACWANSIRHLYQFRVDHRQKGDIAAHLRDARWCVRYDLYDLAEAELQAIRELDPRNAQARSIEAQLQRFNEPPATVDASAEMPLPVVRTTAFIDDPEDAETVDLPMLRRFASQVQPMLLNRCGRCHTRDSNLQWRLDVPFGGARASARMTRENLIGVLEFIEHSSNGESDFLAMATTEHGGGSPPLDPRNAKAIDSLKRWLATVQRRSSTHQSDGRLSNQPSDAVMVMPLSDSPANPRIAQRDVILDDTAPTDGDGNEPMRLPQVANPFDPDLFNRRLPLDADPE